MEYQSIVRKLSLQPITNKHILVATEGLSCDKHHLVHLWRFCAPDAITTYQHTQIKNYWTTFSLFSNY